MLTLLAADARRSEGGNPPSSVSLRLENWTARITPETLTLAARLDSREKEILIGSASDEMFHISDLKQTPDSVRWSIPHLEMDVEIRRIRNRLHLQFATTREMRFTWPASGGDPAFSALLYPDGEGLYIPLGDAFWKARLLADPCRDTHGGLSMPFWSYQIDGGTITYLAVSDLRTEVCFAEQGGRLSTYAVHDFRRRDGLPPYEIEIWPGGSSAVSPAIEYRQWLIENGSYVTLDEKIRQNPEVEKLLGALHAYVFGDGRALELLQELARLGIGRMWLGYDQDPRQPEHLVDRQYIDEARKLGYLIGPYDSFADIQDPRSADSYNAVWDSDLYRTGCVEAASGGPVSGFGGRGCELSSEALELAEPGKHYMERRVSGHAATGINSYFLDVDAYGELYDDYSSAHPMTLGLDRLNRLKRMKYIAQTRKLVLGSESGAAWSAPVIDFAHGMEAVSNDLLWAAEKDRKTYGGWWPSERPANFFRRVEVSPEFAKAKYDPTYRLPLFQAAFHGSVVTTDRWEVPLTKFPELIQTRMLLELLYNVPSMWSLDLTEIRQDHEMLAGLSRFFTPIHRQVGDKPLSQFEWLTPDRKVQRTRFGDEIALTANFGEGTYQSIPPLCIQAQWLREPRSQTFCPKPHY